MLKIMKQSLSRKTHTLDATNEPLGRLASKIANLLRGKRKVGFRPYRDQGDFVIVNNASKVSLTGKKEDQKVYYRWTGYPGGLKKIPYQRMKATQPRYVIRNAVLHMLPKNRLQKNIIRRLTINP